jgi:peptidoglycan hydrolase CwlO-like protein
MSICHKYKHKHEDGLNQPICVHNLPHNDSITPQKFLAVCGSKEEPSISFIKNTTTGWYLNDEGKVALSVNGIDSIIQHPKSTEFKTSIKLYETNEPCATEESGLLFKKIGSDGLWWKTTNGITDLTKLIDNIENNSSAVDHKVDAVESKVNSVESKVDAVENKVNSVESKVDAVENKVNSVENKVNSVENKVDAVENKVDAVESKVDAVESKVNSVENKVDAVDHKVDAVDHKVDAVESKVNSVENKVDAVESKVNAVDHKVDAVESKVNAVESKVDTVENKVNSVESKVDAVESKVDAVESKVDAVESKVDAVESKVDAVESKVDAVESKVDAVESKVDAVESKVDAVDHKVGVISSELSGLTTSVSSLSNAVIDVQSIINCLNTTEQPTISQLKLDNGTVITPSLSFLSSLSTGLFSPAQDVIGVVSGGSAKLIIGPEEIILYDKLVIKDSNTTTPSISQEGHLYKKSGDKGLFWSTLNGEIDITKSSFPQLSTNDGNETNPMFGFTSEYGTGIYKLFTGGLGISINGNNVLSIDKNIISANKPIELKDSEGSIILDNNVGRLYKKNGQSGLFWSTGGLEIDLTTKPEQKEESNTIPVIISEVTKSDLAEVQYNVTDLQTAVTNIQSNLDTLSNQSSQIASNITDQITNLNDTQYKSNISMRASTDIVMGDVVCIDPSDNSSVCKALGGLWSKVNMGTCNTNLNGLIIQKQDGKTIMIGSHLDDSNNLTLYTGQFVTNNLEFISNLVLDYNVQTTTTICFCDLITDNKIFVAWMQAGTNIIKLCKIKINSDLNLTVEGDIQPISLNFACENMALTYDASIDTVILTWYSSAASNFIVCLVLANTNNTDNVIIGTINHNISLDHIIESTNKHLNIVSVPGQIALISYGNRKIAIALTSYLTAVNTGETMLDYESYDCADMLYDTNYGVVISVEKTNAMTCFVQILDILGTKIQKITSKKFNTAYNMEPFNIANNPNKGNYLLLFADSNVEGNIYGQYINFDGEQLSFGLRYLASQDNVYTEQIDIVRHSKWIYPADDGFLAYWPSGINQQIANIAKFIDGYHGYPSNYIGLANNTVNAGSLCDVTIKGHIYNSGVSLPQVFVGKKLYLANLTNLYPANISTNASNGSFIGTCINTNKIMVGL